MESFLSLSAVTSLGDSEEKNIKLKETKSFNRLGYFLHHSKAINEHLKIQKAKI